MELILNDLAQLPEVAAELLSKLTPGVITFQADMGAGKTTLINELCKQLEVEDETSSPTYSIVNEYYSTKNGTIYHFDCYRLESEEEAYDIGIEDYLDSGNYCFIEWPEKIQNLLPDNSVSVTIQVKDETRFIRLENEHIR